MLIHSLRNNLQLNLILLNSKEKYSLHEQNQLILLQTKQYNIYRWNVKFQILYFRRSFGNYSRLSIFCILAGSSEITLDFY